MFLLIKPRFFDAGTAYHARRSDPIQNSDYSPEKAGFQDFIPVFHENWSSIEWGAS